MSKYSLVCKKVLFNFAVCTSIDVRNTLSQFEKLRGCKVVEGFVHILLFDNFNDTYFMNISFPELTEITDYLLVYRVSGLRSLGQIFPNLAVIRGQSLFFTYSLVIYEMPSLLDIGLYSLTDITHGLVRIDKNPLLCFIHSVDWDVITHEKGENFIRSIKPDNECPLCPGEHISTHRDENKVSEDKPSICPNSTKMHNWENQGGKRYLCWNRQYCQKICDPKCKSKSCNKSGNCCDYNCLGGCSEDRTDHCVVCRNFSILTNNDRECVTHCRSGFYEVSNCFKLTNFI